jgi:hypothetical protein
MGLLTRASRGRFGAAKAKALKESATKSLAAQRRDPGMACLHEPRFAEIYNHHKHQLHKHHSVAISHVARKLLAIIYAVCARGQSYDPTKICAQPT